MHRIQNQQASLIQVPSCRDWTLQNLLARKNFLPVRRISASDIKLGETINDFDRRGLPLVVEGLHKQLGWNDQIFSPDWLEDKSGIKEISVRNVHTNLDSTLPLSEFTQTVRESPQYVQLDETERLYGKDLDCPAQWTSWLCSESVVPQITLPTCDNIMSHLPSTSKVDTLMCYIGAGDTFTPSHKDSCASNGQNLMVYAENGGSSYWFMTKQEDARKVADYFHTHLGHDIDHESHVTSVEEFANAPFNVYVLEQKVGDLVLVPRMSCHQVVNNAGLTVKIAWSRLTLKGAIQALDHELPLYRRVCRREIYRIKFVLFYTTKALSKQVKEGNNAQSCSRRLARAQLALDEVLKNECVSNHEALSRLHTTDTYLSCDFCGADIFQSFFECEECHASDTSDSCTICPDCYVEGRTCRCQSMQPKQFQPLENILQERRVTIGALREYWKSNAVGGVNFEPEKNLFDKGAFKAGCLLLSYREQEKGSKSCNNKGPRSEHDPLSFGDAVSCTQCHRATCHYHLLHDYRLHACETILQVNQDSTKKSHHLRHTGGNDKYKQELAKLVDFMTTESKAKNVEGRETQLVDLALNFPRCRPINFSNTQAGWYDEIIVAPVTVRFNKPPNSMARSPPPPYEEGSRRGNNPSLSNNTSAPSGSSSSTNAGPSNRATTRNPPSARAETTTSSRQTKEKKTKLVFDGVLLRSMTQSAPSTEQPEIIDLSSDTPSPLSARTRRGRPRTNKGGNQKAHDEDMIISGPNSNGTRTVEPSNFTNDLASAITASAIASTEESSTSPSPPTNAPIASSSRHAIPLVGAPTASSRPVIPTAKKAKKRPTEEASSSTSPGKRRRAVVQSDPDSSDDDQPMVARPHIPAKKPALVGQPGRKLAVELGKRSSSLTTRPSRPSFKPAPPTKPADHRTANAGSKGSDFPSETAAHSPPPKADLSYMLKSKSSLPNFSKTMPSWSSEKMAGEPVAESSRMASMREERNDVGGMSSSMVPGDTTHNFPQNVPASSSPQFLLTSPADQSAVIGILIQMLHSSIATTQEVRMENMRLVNRIEELERGKTQSTAQQQQQQQQAVENSLNQTQTFVQQYLPTLINQQVDSRVQGFLTQIMMNTSHPMSLPAPLPPPNFPFSRQMNSRNDYISQPPRGRGSFRGYSSPRHQSNSQHHRNPNYQDFNRRSSHGPPRFQPGSLPVAPQRESPRRESSRHDSPQRESSRHGSPRRDSPRRGSSRRRTEPDPKPMDVDEADNNSAEEGVSRSGGGEDRNEDRIGNRIENRHEGSSNVQNTDADAQDWEMGYEEEDPSVNPWKEHSKR